MKRIDIKRRPGALPHQGLFSFNGKTIPCCLGRSGITTCKREGDGATPAGQFKILYGFYRQEKLPAVQSQLMLFAIKPNYGWCDQPNSANYNQFVELPYKQSHEEMYRRDRLYDVCIVLDYNIFPRKRGGGSAIFFHHTNIENGPTEGCVAIDPKYMRLLLPELSEETLMVIHP